MGDFVHLHLHTDYSLLDGACAISWGKIKDLELRKLKTDVVGMAVRQNARAVAITDHGTMGGCVEFSEALSGAKIKPIIGCEVYVAPGSRLEQTRERYHLILLAASATGYRNLCEIVSDANLNGFYYRPRTDLEFLSAHNEGLIAMSACLQGELAVSALRGGEDDARKTLSRYLDIFGRDRFFLEVMDHGIPGQKTVNRVFGGLSRKTGIPLVATNDVHYLKKEHARAHDLMLCIQTRSQFDDPDRMRMSRDEFYFKDYDEMNAIFGNEFPDAVPNTLAVAEKCDFSFNFQQNHYPVYKVQKGTTQGKVLRDLCLKNFPGRYGFDPEHPDEPHRVEAEKLLARMEYELSVIEKTKYPSYFLVVWDFIHAAKSMGIPVGPGRGSGAGSLVAYLAGITDIDPIRYNLIFERFLNPERVSPPDFDIDFCERRRGEVIDYVTKKYGSDCVSQIATYGTLKAKAVLKDVARVLGRTPAEGDRLTKLVPNELDITLEKAYRNSAEFRNFLTENSWAEQVYRDALPLEGLNRNAGIHAAGVIIGDSPLASIVPLFRGTHDEVVVQYVAHPCEELGLLKMDFLGLRTLTLIDDTVKNIRRDTENPDFSIEKIPLDDSKTFELLSRGDTVAVFQLESGGMRTLCRRFGVDSIENIIALLAIYRPGPMAFIPSFIARKRGEEKIEYDHPLMEPILRETFGIMLYQEQVMALVQALAGFTLGHADIVRRAIGKKKADEMARQKIEFIDGCAKTNNIPRDVAERIWDKINMFAGYGFNKSHSAAYAILSYRTAYLKANYPREFMAAELTSELDHPEKVAFLIGACRDMNIPVLPPDINRSFTDFTVDGSSIRFGLAAIKGLGESASSAIISARESGGPFRDMIDLLERAGAILNSKSVESLIRSGALDSTGMKRSRLLASIDGAFKLSSSLRKDRESGQGSLFDLPGVENSGAGKGGLAEFSSPDLPEIDPSERLRDEKELLGFYVSGHPAEKYAYLIRAVSTIPTTDILQLDSGTFVKLGGIIVSAARKLSKKSGKPFAVLEIGDLEGTVECTVYENTLESCRNFVFLPEFPVFITGTVRKNDENSPVVLIAKTVVPLENAVSGRAVLVRIVLDETKTSPDMLYQVRMILMKHAGNTPVELCVRTRLNAFVHIRTARRFSVAPSPEFLQELQTLSGVLQCTLPDVKNGRNSARRFSGPQTGVDA